MKLIKVGFEVIWLRVAIGYESKEIIGINVSKERNIFVAERFLSNIIKSTEIILFHQIWCYLVPISMSISKTCSPSSFLI